MKSILIALLLGVGLLFSSGTVDAAVDGPHAHGGRTCKGCHVPHYANTTRLLWGRSFTTKAFRWSDATATVNGTPLPAEVAGSPGTSRFCISCHDGSKAYNPLPWGPGASTGSTVDLKGNHPIGIPYPAGGKANTYNGITTGGGESGVTVAGFNPAPVGVKLYRDEAGTGGKGVECGSCHDPHTQFAVPSGKYLRVDYTNSEICTACHAK